MDDLIDPNRTAGLLAESTEHLKRLLQDAYQMGFIDGVNYQHRQQSNLFQTLAVDYTKQVERYQQELNARLGNVGQGGISSDPRRIRAVGGAAPVPGDLPSD